jgi:large subunit ribosomal protein L35
MPKMKSHRGAAKRFKATGQGRLKHKQPYTSHILTSKTAKRKRQLRQAAYMSTAETKSLRVLLPYL